MEKRRIKLELSYDGSRYHGWQTQADLPTVQQTLERKLEKIVHHKVNVLGSGRTDAGVHALKQVATFATTSHLPTPTIHKAINGHLPLDIRVYSAVDIPMEFHPINDVIAKRYRYLIDDVRPFFPFFRNYCWQYLKPLDMERMRTAATLLVGTHDFACFQSQGSPRESTVRTVFDAVVYRTEPFGPWIQSQRSGGLIAIEVEADGFLYNMVRAIAGTLALIGSSDTCNPKSRAANKPPQWIQEMLESRIRDEAGPTAPPQGLYMLNVRYPCIIP